MNKFKNTAALLFLTLSMGYAVPTMAAPISDTPQTTEYTEASASVTDTASDNASAEDASDESGAAVSRVIRLAEETDSTAAKISDEVPEDKTSEDAVSTEASEQSAKLTGSKIAEFARQFLGGRYRYSGSSLTNGADCSGFTMAVYRNFGISLPHSSSAQRSAGTAVGSLEEAQAGDLICYSGHVALYLGNGQIIHAMNEKKGIVISNARYNRILAIRRII